MAEEPLIAVFVDFENLALGVRDNKGADFSIQLILKRLLEKGRIVFKRAYCDWSNYRSQVREFHQQGIELVDIPRSKMSGKNSADIHMVVDALDLCYSKQHIDFFALLTGDSDFSPLVSKLKENDKRVLGCGIKNSTSNLLIANCDEFIYYDDLVRAAEKPRKKTPRRRTKSSDGQAEKAQPVDKKRQEGVEEVVDVVRSLALDYDPLWGSMVKQTMRRVNPSFNESYYGYQSFAELLKEAEEQAYIELEYDTNRGNYKVRLRGD